MSLILVTGANGFIGSHVAESLIRGGHRVRGLVRRSSDLKMIEGMDIDLFFGDVRDAASLKAPMKDVDRVIHTAGFVSDWGPFEAFYETNVTGTRNAARAAAANGVERFVHISTTALHGFKNGKGADESCPPADTAFPYCETKKEAERWLFEFTKNTDMPATAVRPGNVFGPRDQRFIGQYLEAVEQGRMGYIDGGKHWTCPTYVENLAEGILLACFEERAAGEAFVITDGLEIDWRSFTEAFAEALGVNGPRLSIPFPIAYTLASLMEGLYRALRRRDPPMLTRYRISNGGRDYHFSIEKAKRVLNFRPRVDFETAVARTVAWYRGTRGGSARR